MKKITIIYIFLLNMVAHALDNGLAKTPPMGWMTWERFRCNIDCVNDPENCISEKLIMQMADRMSEDGYLEAGYQYLAIDDCWMSKERDSKGRLQADPVRFPSGIKFLADYIHSKGLKFGIYGDIGTRTCKNYPGNQYYIPLDAETYASWGVDMLKLDCCFTGYNMVEGYEVMGFFLNKTGRPVLYSCSFPACMPQSTNFNVAAKLCNTWRNAVDLMDTWDRVYQVIQFYGNNTKHFAEVAGPGNWNDPDELIVGDYGMSQGQQQAQFGMWALMASPLFMSVDLRNIDVAAKDILLNQLVLDINQDPLGIQGKRVWRVPGPIGNVEGWLRPLSPKGKYAVGILNGSIYGEPQHINKTIKELGLKDESGYTLTDVFTLQQYGPYNLTDRLTIQIHPTNMFLAIAIPESHKTK